MKTINTLAILTSTVCLSVLLFGLYQSEYFAGSIAFWLLSIGSLLTALVGVFSGARCE